MSSANSSEHWQQFGTNTGTDEYSTALTQTQAYIRRISACNAAHRAAEIIGKPAKLLARASNTPADSMATRVHHEHTLAIVWTQSVSMDCSASHGVDSSYRTRRRHKKLSCRRETARRPSRL